jgi:hypothetical protein
VLKVTPEGRRDWKAKVMMDRQCGQGYKYCWGKKLEICSHELGKLAEISLKGQDSLCAVVPVMM